MQNPATRRSHQPKFSGGLIAALALLVVATQLFATAARSNPQGIASQHPPRYAIHHTGALKARHRTIKLGLRPLRVHPIVHEPAEPLRPLPVGRFNPWKTIGFPTQLHGAIGPTPMGGGPSVPRLGTRIMDGTSIIGDARLVMIPLQVNVSKSLGRPNNWETNVASAGDVILYTSNWDDAFSVDGGQTFAEVDPYSLMSDLPGGFCCDQVVQYVPKIERFIWVLQSGSDKRNENEYRLLFASPGDIKSGQGKILWYEYDLTSRFFNQPGSSLDYPEIAVGDDYLYMSFDIVGGANGGKAIITRIPLSTFAVITIMQPADYFVVDGWFVRPVQNTGSQGIFATENGLSQIRLMAFVGNTNASGLRIFDSDIKTIPTYDPSSIVPGGTLDWLGPSTKYGTHIYGATQAGNQIWLAWNAARGYDASSPRVFPQAHIELAVLDTASLQLINEYAIYSNDFAYAYPALATDSHGYVGITFAAGGGTIQVQPGIGFLTKDFVLVSIPTGINPSNGSGGHFMGIRPQPGGRCFATAVFAGMSGSAQAFFVLFGHSNRDAADAIYVGCRPSTKLVPPPPSGISP